MLFSQSQNTIVPLLINEDIFYMIHVLELWDFQAKMNADYKPDQAV